MTHTPTGPTVDPAEVARFAALADAWWDPTGEMRPLHRLNPVRLGYIRRQVGRHFGRGDGDRRPFAGLRLLDLGCGGGLLAEPMARLGATVTGADAAAETVRVAALHAAGSGLDIDYRHTTAEAMAAAGERFDVVLTMEVVEHVSDLDAFLQACGGLLQPGGILLLATLNRTLKAFGLAIVGAEYVLGWLPRGTHRYDRFVRPHELARGLRRAGLRLTDVTGISYRPLADRWETGRDLDVNYLATAVRSAV